MKFLFELFRKALNGARRAANRARQGRGPTRCAPFCIEEYRLGHRGTVTKLRISGAALIPPEFAQKTAQLALKTQGL
jgi:hypothetical protein